MGDSDPHGASNFGSSSCFVGFRLVAPIPAFGAPKVLLQAQGMNMGGSGTVWGWAITPDGKRVLARSFASVATNALEDIDVVLNWPSLVK